MSIKSSLPAFGGYGVELEYMIVDRATLAVMPIADKVLPLLVSSNRDKHPPSPELTWSHELMSHVLELKNALPVQQLDGLIGRLPRAIEQANVVLAPFGAALLGTGMHPWMDPRADARLWPHDPESIYRTYHRIFNCAGHGWSNLQSMHLNLAFGNDEEFERLHTAIRLVLPILPALSASSPLADGRITGFLDYRMEVYRSNASSIPSIAGDIIPEVANSQTHYQQLILDPMYADIALYDPDRVLRHEWLNSRGAIARFDRNAIEIRLLDTQECPAADLAIATVAIAVVKALFEEKYQSLGQQQLLSVEELAAIFRDCIRSADEAMISNAAFLKAFNYAEPHCSAAQLWRHLVERVIDTRPCDDCTASALETLLSRGPLARRILRAIETQPGSLCRARLMDTYLALSECLNANRMFVGLS